MRRGFGLIGLVATAILLGIVGVIVIVLAAAAALAQWGSGSSVAFAR